MTAPFFPLSSYDITTGASSAASANPFPVGVQAVQLTATAACRVRFATAPVAVVADTLIAPNFPVVFRVVAGQKVAAIQEAAGGKLNITELSA